MIFSKSLWCPYCHSTKPEGTKFYSVTARGGRRTGRKCADCRKRQAAPVPVRDERGRRNSEDKRGASTRRQQELKRTLQEQVLQRRREHKE